MRIEKGKAREFLPRFFLKKNKELHAQEIELKGGVRMIAKRENIETVKLFFGGENAWLIIKEAYVSNGKEFCKTMDYSSRFPWGGERIHVASFLKDNFEVWYTPRSLKK